MRTTQPDIIHLVSLIEAAAAEATRAGHGEGEIARLLEQALVQARSLAAQGGRADEGLTPDQLTTETDR